MIVTILVIATIVCAFGWLTRWVSTAALLMWIEEKGYTLPDRTEIGVYTRKATMQLFRCSDSRE